MVGYTLGQTRHIMAYLKQSRRILQRPSRVGLWKHKTKNIQFVLVVDDFGIKYTKKEDLDHLISLLKSHHDVSVDLKGKEFVKIELHWDYKKEEVHLFMEPYLRKALIQFDNLVPKKCQDSPYPHIEPEYGAKVQYAEYDTSPAVVKGGQKHIQMVWPRG